MDEQGRRDEGRTRERDETKQDNETARRLCKWHKILGNALRRGSFKLSLCWLAGAGRNMRDFELAWRRGKGVNAASLSSCLSFRRGGCPLLYPG
jgi:hypothetical protein